jgi:hypothetical protein
MKTGNSIKMREINKNVKLNCAFMSKSSSNFKYMSTKKLLRLSEMEDDDNTDVKNKTIDSIRVNNHQNID